MTLSVYSSKQDCHMHNFGTYLHSGNGKIIIIAIASWPDKSKTVALTVFYYDTANGDIQSSADDRPMGRLHMKMASY